MLIIAFQVAFMKDYVKYEIVLPRQTVAYPEQIDNGFYRELTFCRHQDLVKSK